MTPSKTGTSKPIERYLPLHPLEFRILLVLLDGPSHGYRIVKAIEERVGDQRRIYPANLYRRIRDLLERGLIEETVAPAGEESEGRRTYVTVSRLGRQVARAEAERLESLVADARQRRLLGRAR
jgi:DNA-binding PadR family transcriptional regulator